MRKVVKFLGLFLIIGLASCSPTLSNENLLGTQAVLVETITAEELTRIAGESTEVPVAPADTPVPAPEYVLITHPNDDPQVRATVEASLTNYASSQGIGVTVLAHDAVPNFTSGTALVVVLSGAAENYNYTQIPEFTQTIVIGGSPQTAPTHLTQINTSGLGVAQQGFLAGYLATVIEAQYRVGIINTPDSNSLLQQIGFLNGARYFCGLCTPAFPPYYQYPLYSQADSSEPSALQFAASDLVSKSVSVIYLPPESDTADIRAYLESEGVQYITNQAYPDNPNWLGSFVVDLQSQFEKVLPLVVTKGAQGTLSVNVTLVTNSTWVSEGRLNHILQVIPQITSGEIDPIND